VVVQTPAKIQEDQKFFLDSAKVDEIRYARDMWNIDGVTSNPRRVRWRAFE